MPGFPVEILVRGGDNFPRPTIKGKIRYQDDNIGLKQSLIVNIQVLFCIFSYKRGHN